MVDKAAVAADTPVARIAAIFDTAGIQVKALSDYRSKLPALRRFRREGLAESRSTSLVAG